MKALDDRGRVDAGQPVRKPAPVRPVRIDSPSEPGTADEVVAFAVDHFGRDLVLAASFQDCVLIDVATRVEPTIQVLFLDTGYHFPETLAYVERVRCRYDLRLHIARPDGGDNPPCGQDGCCDRRKVTPLARALAGKRAWMSGVRRADSSARARTPTVSWDARRGLVKFNPLATWSDDDVDRYIEDHRLPRHPLTLVGYPSIGCAPTTEPVERGGLPRSGRWRDTNRTECGIHL